MRVLVDEHVAAPVVVALRARDHDVFSVKESMPGADDPAILALAQAQQRVIVTT